MTRRMIWIGILGNNAVTDDNSFLADSQGQMEFACILVISAALQHLKELPKNNTARKDMSFFILYAVSAIVFENS